MFWHKPKTRVVLTSDQLPKPKTEKHVPTLTGYAVRIGDRVEYWAYDPKILTAKQRKDLALKSWKKFHIKVKDTDRG